VRRSVIGWTMILAAASFAQNRQPPDPRSGNVNGVAAVLYWPSVLATRAGEAPKPLATAEGCEVHLVAESKFDEELRYPCGEWFVPRGGKYAVWLETAGGISPTQNLLIYTPKSFAGRGMPAFMPVVPAGRIGIPANRAVTDGESLRLFSTRTEFWWTKSAWIFDRRLHSRVVQMPAGASVILGRFDRRTNDAIALARPVLVKEAQTQEVWPVEPNASDVLVILRKPPALQMRKPAPSAELTLDGRKADVLVNGGDRIVAVWYGVDAPRAKIAFASDAAHWEAREIRLAPGKVVTIRDEVKPLPSAKISINAPSGAKLPDAMFLEVSRAADTKPLRRVAANLGVHELNELPADPLRVTLRLEQWEWSESLDLTRGDDGQVAFDLEPIAIHGTVFHGRDPTAAELSFRNGDDRWAVVKTDENGRYETTLWWSDVQTVRVMLPGRPPFLDPFREIFASGRVDFHVPRTDYHVRVRDAQTGKGIAGARVSAGNVVNGGMRVAQHAITNADGEAVLPPLRDGELIVSVEAERYARAEPQRMIVDEKRHELEIALQPLRMTASLRILLPNGAAASEAEVWALDAAANPLWRGRADAEGVVELPELPAGALLLARHPQAASAIRRESGGEWTLALPAATQTIHTKPHTPIALWLDGVRLTGPLLSFAAWSGPSANPMGVWVGRNLPHNARLDSTEF
jgi:Carboxypeptidase regulatory-like domain